MYTRMKIKSPCKVCGEMTDGFLRIGLGHIGSGSAVVCEKAECQVRVKLSISGVSRLSDWSFFSNEELSPLSLPKPDSETTPSEKP